MAGRALHGVNLTGWLTLEPWVTPSLFADSGALDEDSLVIAMGQEPYRQMVEKHRRGFLSQVDFRGIAARGFNAVRLEVPWYVFGDAGPETGPYVGCIDHVDQAFVWAEDIDLKIVLALAITPGERSSSAILVRNHDEFSRYRNDMLVVLGTLAKRYCSRAALAGIEVADEVVPQVRHGFTLTDGVPLHQLRNYYRAAYDTVRKNAPDATVILPDAGQPGAWGHFMAPRRYQNVWLDSHLYHYLDRVDGPGPTGIRELSQRSHRMLETARRCGLPVMAGKWSASLPFADSSTTPEGRIALERVFVSEQLAVFRKCPAWFFQTWKTEGRLSGWDARVALATFERAMLA
ncbi:glucan 1,3-beta-glucosidase [Olsenella profusa DSM 13989]|uniref:glycoside hydrolase family 5 protein n=1 Tax=Olsenella profusa TaxID=138595 RepID=UPI0027890309|nr:cellulase family glycosylhydrolase [Olsenella profusa]MDP9859730.1 glucan 1,3-beta-glucosidase [Olsenella profusa DSM 13989]